MGYKFGLPLNGTENQNFHLRKKLARIETASSKRTLGMRLRPSPPLPNWFLMTSYSALDASTQVFVNDVSFASRNTYLKMAFLAGFCAIFFLFSLPTSAQQNSRNCTMKDYVQLILPCDVKTRTRSVVYYLNSNW